jgi:hypothetical protein
MRKRLMRFIRSTVVSFEIVSVCLIMYINIKHPFLFSKIGLLIDNNTRIFGFCVTYYGGAIASTIWLCKGILLPDKTKYDLEGWPKYSELRITCMVGILWVIFAAFLSIAGIIFKEYVGMRALGMMCVSGFCVSGLSFLSILWAYFVAGSILSGYE